MKKIILLISLTLIIPSFISAQNKKAERDSLAMVLFNKAVKAIDDKDFVIVVDIFQDAGGAFINNTDLAVFMSYEKEFILLQGALITNNSFTNKLTIYEYNQSTDKKGNINVTMQTKGFYINAKIEISLRKGNNNADVIITPTRGEVKRFTGKIVPTSESNYFKRAGYV
jgi:hypothetical protein